MGTTRIGGALVKVSRKALTVLRSLSPLAAAGLTLAVVFGGYGAAVAATGGAFVLGRANHESSTASLSDKRGTPLSLSAPRGRAPLAVNSATQVRNLNASLLGGLAASRFDQGGTKTASNGFTLTGTTNAELLAVPGYGRLQAYCKTSNYADVEFVGSRGLEMFNASASVSPVATNTIFVPANQSNTANAVTVPGQTGWSQTMVLYQTGSGKKTHDHVATMSTMAAFQGNSCIFAATMSAGPATAGP